MIEIIFAANSGQVGVGLRCSQPVLAAVMVHLLRQSPCFVYNVRSWSYPAGKDVCPVEPSSGYERDLQRLLTE
jgi:hypothetical protein